MFCSLGSNEFNVLSMRRNSILGEKKGVVGGGVGQHSFLGIVNIINVATSLTTYKSSNSDDTTTDSATNNSSNIVAVSC